MTVSVTSDLVGYAAFWTRTLWWIALVALVLLAPVYVLLILIWQRLASSG